MKKLKPKLIELTNFIWYIFYSKEKSIQQKKGEIESEANKYSRKKKKNVYNYKQTQEHSEVSHSLCMENNNSHATRMKK